MNKEEIIDAIISCYPDGKIYNKDDKELRNLLSGFANEFYIAYNDIDQNIRSLLEIDIDNVLLDRYKKDYGIPNPIFEDVGSKEELVFAIAMMKQAKNLISVKDYENFLATLGFEVKFYQLNNVTSTGFDYNFPITFSLSTDGKDKYTWWYWVKEGFTEDFNNIGDAFPIEFSSVTQNAQKVKKILDYLKPDYLKFTNITTYTKTLYGL